ncbi:uncharacterized protein BJ171DRAFT_410643, partial [Polychytrium aggregatum]|uniref:uncharacterized protein n=1 Tax=Polychytrium aggregatum TaxID=110093 RepID=UPI0022FE5F58
WVPGHATHYGPYPQYPAWSEVGYLPGDIGVGCSNGQPGGDPNWDAILSNGTYPSPAGTQTVWPIVATVAVSQKYWASNYTGQTYRAPICWNSIWIRNPAFPNDVVEAQIVDYCPTQGCTWSEDELPYNVDIYGGATWTTLHGQTLDAKIAIEIIWP